MNVATLIFTRSVETWTSLKEKLLVDTRHYEFTYKKYLMSLALYILTNVGGRTYYSYTLLAISLDYQV